MSLEGRYFLSNLLSDFNEACYFFSKAFLALL